MIPIFCYFSTKHMLWVLERPNYSNRPPDKCVYNFILLFLKQNICCGYSKGPTIQTELQIKVCRISFCYFSSKTYVEGIQKNCFIITIFNNTCKKFPTLTWNFFLFLSSADFFQNQCFWKILSGIFIPSECQTVWIQIRPDILSGLIWVQTVCKGCQQTTW